VLSIAPAKSAHREADKAGQLKWKRTRTKRLSQGGVLYLSKGGYEKKSHDSRPKKAASQSIRPAFEFIRVKPTAR
jgi:hypothetical protein